MMKVVLFLFALLFLSQAAFTESHAITGDASKALAAGVKAKL